MVVAPALEMGDDAALDVIDEVTADDGGEEEGMREETGPLEVRTEEPAALDPTPAETATEDGVVEAVVETTDEATADDALMEVTTSEEEAAAGADDPSAEDEMASAEEGEVLEVITAAELVRLSDEIVEVAIDERVEDGKVSDATSEEIGGAEEEREGDEDGSGGVEVERVVVAATDLQSVPSSSWDSLIENDSFSLDSRTQLRRRI